MNNSILSTKVYPPPGARDLILRPLLRDRLIQATMQGGVTLVCAPAGYGKSTLVANWLKEETRPSAWLSLDSQDAAPAQFLSAVVTACRRPLPGFGEDMLKILEANDIPSPKLMANSLVETIGDREFILVLDDYHEIKNESIHEMLTEFLRHPPPRLHLVIICRQDPPLPLAKMRADGRFEDIRLEDLRFSVEETARFLEQSTGTSFDQHAVEALNQRCEGWPAATRLAAIAIGKQGNLDRILAMEGSSSGYLRDYLVTEVLLSQPREVRDALLKTSMLGRFCAPLCESICGEGLNGGEFLNALREANLFLIDLDNEGTWYRYHSMFRDVLQHRLKKQTDPREIQKLHHAAAEWYEGEGLLEDALEHYLGAGDSHKTHDFVRRHRQTAMDNEHWTQLERWIALIPREITDGDLEFLIIRAWILENRYRYSELFEALDRIRELASGLKPGDSDDSESLRGEVAALEAGRQYLIGNASAAKNSAERALESLPKSHISQRGYANVVKAISQQQLGDATGGRLTALGALQDREKMGTTHHSRALIGLGFINWMEADAPGLLRVAEQLISMGNQHQLPEAEAFGRYFKGITYLDEGRLEAARDCLAPQVQQRYPINTFNYVNSIFGLSLVHQLADRHQEAADLAASVGQWALEHVNPEILGLAEAFEAEIAFRAGRRARARAWAGGHEPNLSGVRLRFYVPELTLARILLAEDENESVKRAGEMLLKLHAAFSATHNRRLLIDVNALLALFYQIRGDDDAAVTSLKAALELSQPSRIIRPFMDLGKPMAILMQRMGKEHPSKFVGELLSEFRKQVIPESPQRTSYASSLDLESLTERETEIVSLLAERLSDKAIAERLFISPGTVKKHLNNIYGKLNAHNRSEAAAKAKELRFI